MAEIFATAATAAAVLEQSIALFSRVRQAVARQKGLPELISKYSAEVSQTKTIVELAASEAALKTPNVGATIVKLAAVGEALHSHLSKVASTKGRVHGFVRQLVSGRQDQEKLEEIMGELGNAKQDLSLGIQLANVGLTRAVGETLQVNAAAVDTVNKLLTERLGPTYTLRMARLIEGRPRNADGSVTLTEDDIASLSTESNVAGGTTPETSRIVRENQASGSALQVNTPIGEDLWKDMGNITIERNQAQGSASQWNYPISADTFLAALQTRQGQSDPKP
ncbi:hypothetical protein B0I37DRAFT_369468 [Chaetomium sp. MPI-CAGE-AT-0009]|nr:hypothetical protein B0I37DRAFT_369468 [Chaetomium sp. MPI-CAGE-AT-0009]